MNNITPAKITSGAGGLQSFTEVARSHGKKVHTDVLEVKQLLNPDVHVRKKLKLETRLDQTAIHLKRIRYWNDDPITFENIYISGEYLKDFSKINFAKSLFEILSKKVEISYSNEEIEAVLVDNEISKILGLEIGQPLFKVKSTIYTPDAKPIMFDTSFYRADKYSFKNTLTRHH